MFTILSKSLKKRQWQPHFIWRAIYIYIFIYIYRVEKEKKTTTGSNLLCVLYGCATEERKREARFNSDIFSLPFFFLFNRCMDVCLFYSVIRKKILITTYLTRDFGSDFIPNTSSLLSRYTAFALCPFIFLFWLHLLTVWRWKRK